MDIQDFHKYKVLWIPTGQRSNFVLSKVNAPKRAMSAMNVIVQLK